MTMQKNRKTRREDRIGTIKTILSEGNSFKGKIEAKDSLQILGKFEGEIECKNVVWVNKEGLVKGTINSNGVIIEGKVNGNIESAQWVELRESGELTGNISADKIALAQGCFFEGEIKMKQKGEKPLKFVEKRTSGNQK